MTTTAPYILDVTDDTFEQVVIEGSKQRPVVVDLWAEWCGPCRSLGPILEKVASERAGGFLLAKVDVDNGQVGNALLQAIGSQSIPTVVAFRDGQPVNAFIGAYPEEAVNEFVDTLLPTEAELVAVEAMAEEEAGDLQGAEQGYRQALEKDPGNRDAAIGLARLLVEGGDVEEAQGLLDPLLPDPEAEAVSAAIRVRGWAGLTGDTPLDAAKVLAASGRWREALDEMLRSLVDRRDEARAALVDSFAVLGDEDPLVSEYRRKLASALF
jgi:putative thioredoxin